MTWINYDDVLSQLQGAGFDLADLVVGERKRCKVVDVAQKGWYALHEITLDDGRHALVGAFGWWIGAEKFVENVKLRVDKQAVKLSAEQHAAVKARVAEEKRKAEAARAALAERAAEAAASAWSAYVRDGESDYLTRKKVRAFGLRFSPSGNGTVAVPIADARGKIWGLQLIRGKKRATGKLEKEYWPKGVLKASHFHSFGGIGPVLLLAEGYATAATLHQATGLPVAVAFDAGNLLGVAQALHKARRGVRILVCADDDYLTAGNPGVKAAENAALAVSGAVVIPAFTAPRAEVKGVNSPTDFNDLAALEGEEAVRAQIIARLDALGWSVLGAGGNSPPSGAGFRTPGGGDSGDGNARPQARSVMAVEDLVERFVPLDDGKGKAVFDTWTARIAHIDQVVALLPAGRRRDDIKQNADYIQRGAYYIDQVGFDPSEKDPEVKLNTWRGWPLEPKAGKCDVFLEMMRYHCNAEKNGDEVYHWLLCWMAYPLQHPGAKMSSSVIMHGPQGTGKSMVFKTLAKIYGAGNRRDYSVVLDQKALADNFNADWENKLFVLAEEVVTRSDMWQLKNELKELVTGDWIRIRKVFTDAYRQRNQINFAFLSNENQPLPLDTDDRRHLVIYTPPQLGEEYYREVSEELENGGVAAFYDYLLKLDLSGFRPKERPPMTEAKQALIALSSPSELRFITDWILGDLGLPIVPCLASDLYAAYLKWCRLNGEGRPRPSNQFHGAVARQPGWEKKRARIFDNLHYSGTSQPKHLIVPPLKTLQTAGREMKPGENVSRWLTDCVFEFGNAVANAGDRTGTHG